jgi:O-antigen ligase
LQAPFCSEFSWQFFLKAENADMRNRSAIYFLPFAAVYVISVYFYFLSGQSFILLIPFGMLFFSWFCLRPEILLYTLLASIPWSIEYNFTQSLGTDLPDEPLMLLTSFAAVGYLLYHYRRKPLTGITSPLLFVLLFQLAWMFISVAFSTDLIVSGKYLLAKTWYLGAFVLAPYVVFRDRKKFLISVLVLASSMMVFTLVTMVRHSFAGLHFSTINPSLTPFFRNHVNYSALLVCILPIVFFLRRTTEGKMKIFLGVVLFIGVVAVYFTYARGAWLALLFGIAAYWLLQKRLLLKTYIISFAIVFAGLAWLANNNKYLDYAHDYNTTIFHKNFEEHLIATYQLKDVSTAERFYRWIAGVRMVKDRWQTGYGPNTFFHHYKEYAVPAFKTWVSKNEDQSTVHNYFLLTIVEQGVPGLVMLLLLIGYMFFTAQNIYNNSSDPFVRRTVSAVAVILAMLCTVNFLSDLVETDKLGSIFYLCLAVLLVMDRNTELNAEDNSVR